MRRFLCVLIVLGVVAPGCGDDETASVECPPGEALAGFEGDECVPLDVSGGSEAEATTTSTTTAAPESSTTTTESSAVDQLETTPAVTGDEIPDQLTWAEEGTTEADIERAFWNARPTRLEIYREDILDPNYAPFVETHTGRDLERITSDIAQLPEGEFYRYPEPSLTQIEFIGVVTPTEALVQVCELNRAEYYTDGELEDDRDGDSQFQARFVLVDGEWLWEETIKLKFEPLEGDLPTCWAS